MKNKITALVLALIILSFCLVSCGAEESHSQSVSYMEIAMTLPEGFGIFDSDGAFDVAYSDGGRVVGITRLSFDACIAEGVLTTMDAYGFARYYINLLGIGSPELLSLGDTVYYTYVNENDEGIPTLHLPQFVVTPYAYVIITYVSYDTSLSSVEAFLEIARTVRLTGKF